MTATKQEYDDSSIDVLEGIVPVYKRPGMYIGNTSKGGLHHLIWEIIDNSVDEAMVVGGSCDKIDVTINEDNSITVVDNGRGIPVAKYKSGTHKGKSTVEVVMTVLHAGGKFNSNAYSLSGGLHGVGISVVNALSDWVNVEVRRDGAIHEVGFETIKNKTGDPDPGVCTMKPKKTGSLTSKDETGTSITFLPNGDVFKTIQWDYALIRNRLMLASVLNPGITCTVEDRRVESKSEREEFLFEGGLEDYMEMIADDRLRDESRGGGGDTEDSGEIETAEDADEAVDNPRDKLVPLTPVHLGQDFGNAGAWDLVMQWFPDYTYQVQSYVNGIHTVDHGTHVQGFQSNLTRIINTYARQDHVGLLTDRDSNLELADIQNGLGAIIAVKVPEPQFEGQTKGKLGNPETKKMVSDGFREQFIDWLQSHPVEAGAIISRMVNEMRIRERMRAAEEAARSAEEEAIPAFEMTPPDKLNDILGKDRSNAELFIVEGDSALNTTVAARLSKYQAILPIRGKMKNASNATMESLSRNAEIRGILYAIGAGSLEETDITKSRYKRIVLLADADDDGFHIQCLILTMLMNFVPALVEEGMVYIARPPLYSTLSIGNEKMFVHSLEEREEVEAEHPKKDIQWTRFKGLGEMDPSELRETAMDPETRSMLRVVVSDIDEALTMMHALMGNNAASKRASIQASEDEDDEEVE